MKHIVVFIADSATIKKWEKETSFKIVPGALIEVERFGSLELAREFLEDMGAKNLSNYIILPYYDVE